MTKRFLIRALLAMLGVFAPEGVSACQQATLQPIEHTVPLLIAWHVVSGAPRYRLVVEARTPEGAVQHYSDRWIVGTTAALDLPAAARTALRVAVLAQSGATGCDAADGRAYLPLAASALLDQGEHCPTPRLLGLHTAHPPSLQWHLLAQATAIEIGVWSALGEPLGNDRLASTSTHWVLRAPKTARTITVSALCGTRRSPPALAIVPGDY